VDVQKWENKNLQQIHDDRRRRSFSSPRHHIIIAGPTGSLTAVLPEGLVLANFGGSKQKYSKNRLENWNSLAN
jgi:hypothetical protein